MADNRELKLTVALQSVQDALGVDILTGQSGESYMTAYVRRNGKTREHTSIPLSVFPLVEIAQHFTVVSDSPEGISETISPQTIRFLWNAASRRADDFGSSHVAELNRIARGLIDESPFTNIEFPSPDAKFGFVYAATPHIRPLRS